MFQQHHSSCNLEARVRRQNSTDESLVATLASRLAHVEQQNKTLGPNSSRCLSPQNGGSSHRCMDGLCVSTRVCCVA